MHLEAWSVRIQIFQRDRIFGHNASLDPWLVLTYAFAWLGVLGSPLVIWIAWRFWRDGVSSSWARIHHMLLAAATVVFAWFAVTWRIAGTTLNY